MRRSVTVEKIHVRRPMNKAHVLTRYGIVMEQLIWEQGAGASLFRSPYQYCKCVIRHSINCECERVVQFVKWNKLFSSCRICRTCQLSRTRVSIPCQDVFRINCMDISRYLPRGDISLPVLEAASLLCRRHANSPRQQNSFTRHIL